MLLIVPGQSKHFATVASSLLQEIPLGNFMVQLVSFGTRYPQEVGVAKTAVKAHG